ncbi:hypothetical protein JAK72_11300 [Stenotrophomonas maltophilia]|uniref:hypothetical protein n=1 Tax=Stenotrophomonas maltophilia TaxID=40324 RepID=UPI0021C8120C|nr:hypothetical protein [Stenotrophomonas maltophilia]MCU1038767.1 hypothetical protein [Stenotrophomonas maltophilia]
MSNDNKTLADVQPGGRVRLGDAPWPEIDAILADAYSAGTEGLPFEGIARRAAVRKAVAALSAQPSPGGQGDALDLVMGECEEWFDTTDVDMVAAAESIIAALAALAARQPVGQIVGYMDPNADFMLARPGDCVLMGNIVLWREPGSKYTKPLYDAPPAQAVDLGQFRPFIVEARNNAYAFIETMRKAGRDSSDAREKAALTERLLDLIDSQVVGNG